MVKVPQISRKDAKGTPVALKDLDQPVATPTMGGVRPVISRQPADGMTPQRLARILKAAAEGDCEAWFELAEDIEERDLHYAAVLATRKRSVAQLPITVMAASDSAEHKGHAALIQQWINDDVLRSSLFDMLDAIGKGVSILEVDWAVKSGATLPARLTWRPQRFFTFDAADGETVLLRDGTGLLPLANHKFLVHRHKSKSGLTIRSGIARVAAWSWMFKSFNNRDWAMFVQNYGQPIRIGKYGPNATEPEKDVLWRAVQGIAGDMAAIIPADMLLEFQEVGGKGATTDLYERRANYLDTQVSKLVLGQTTSTDAISGGHAVSKEHRLVQEDIERSDAMAVSSTLNLNLIPQIVSFNFGPQDHYPRVRIGRPDEVPLSDFAAAFKDLAPLGLTADASFIRDRLGVPEPQSDQLVGGRQPAPAVTSSPPDNVPDKKPAKQSVFGTLFDQDGPPALHRAANLPGADLVEALSARIEEDAAGAMAGLTDAIAQIFAEAKDLSDAAERLSRLELDPEDLAKAMARGLALAHLAGQAALIDTLKDRP